MNKTIIYRLFLSVLILTLFYSNSFSQKNVRIKKSEFKIKDNGFKEAWKSVKKGNKNYRFGAVTYRTAREFYIKALEYNDKNAALNYKAGVSYLYSDNKNLALDYLKKAFELNPQVADDIHLQLARAYHMSYDFDNAIKEYSEFRKNTSEKKLRKMGVNIDQSIKECETGKLLVKEPQRVVIQNIGKQINSEYDDYYPVVDSSENTMYFTSRRPGANNTKRNFYDKKFSEDIYMVKRKSKEWGIGQLLSNKLTTKKSEAAVAISPDNKNLFIYKSNGGGDIYYSFVKNGKWKSPKKFRRINSRGMETSVSFTGDGKRMYFVSNREKGSFGGKDIYMCTIDEKGKWSKPKNIGSPVNTPQNEEGVFVTRDGKTLYFSSKGHPSMGGYDIFKSTINSDGSWSAPVNLGFPVNTPDDDLFINMTDNGKSGYLSSNREQGIGGKDIYKLIFLGAEKEMIMTKESSPLAFEMYDKKTLFREDAGFMTVDSSILISGKVLDADTKEPVIAKLQFINSEKANVAAVLISDSTGNYKTGLPEKKVYGVEITAKGYLFYLDLVDLKKITTDIISKDFYVQKLEVGAKVVLKNIFFETGKATLKDESFQQLNTVVEFMNDNPSLKLEISGHTDNVGALNYNIKLSDSRAKSVVQYLVSQGINASRLTAKGYGPNQPVDSNKTAAGKAKNRRVEFKITGK